MHKNVRLIATGNIFTSLREGDNRTLSGGVDARLTDPRENSMAYVGNVPVEKLLRGISRFQKDVYPKHQDLFEKLAIGQRPEALFITCADSRIDPCLLTQTKPGELFICRVIGNIVPPYPDTVGGVSATIECAVGVLRVPEVIVCGHTDCGVMRGALYPEALRAYPNVTAWCAYREVRAHIAPSKLGATTQTSIGPSMSRSGE
jgi:carbonic anhydrase